MSTKRGSLRPDGVASDPTRGKLLVEEIDFIAVMRWRRDLELLGVLVNGERNRVNPLDIEEMLKVADAGGAESAIAAPPSIAEVGSAESPSANQNSQSMTESAPTK